MIASMLLWRAGIMPYHHPERRSGEAGERLLTVCCVAHWSKAMFPIVQKHLQIASGAIPLTTVNLIRQIERARKLVWVDKKQFDAHPVPSELVGHLPNEDCAIAVRVALASRARFILARDQSFPTTACQAFAERGITLCTATEVMSEA